MNAGPVHLVGAGPGDPALITVRGRAVLRAADVVVHDRLVSSALLTEVHAECELIDVGKTPGSTNVTQETIHQLLIDKARQGLRVVRLKGGDPFLFGRGHEELAAVRAAGIVCTVIPGVTSAVAAPASVGIAVTARRAARSVVVVTASTEDGVDVLDYAALAAIDTVVVLMGRGRLGDVADRLIAAGKAPDTPACCIQRGTWPDQRAVHGTLADISGLADAAGLCPPAITVVGTVARDAAPESAAGLSNRRVVLTRPRDSAAALRGRLEEAGATVVHCPLIAIEQQPAENLQRHLEAMQAEDWIALTSHSAVAALCAALHATGRDARALAGCRIAAVGPGTATALRRRGITADLVPDEYSARGLAAALAPAARGRHVLYPHSDLADGAFARDLEAAGVKVSGVVAYRTVARSWTDHERAAAAEGADALCLYSPSAVASFCAQHAAQPAALACVGPTTARAARSAGLRVDIVADPHDDDGMFQALEQFFTRADGDDHGLSR